MSTQFWGLLMHVALSYLFVFYSEFGVTGTALATFFSNLFIFLVNEARTLAETDLSEVNATRFFDRNVHRNFGDYLRIGIPNMLVIFIEFTSYEIMVLLVGYLGVVEQATQIILLNFIGLPQMIAWAFQQASCAMVGQQIGANNVAQARKIYSVLFIIFVLGDLIDWLILFINRFSIVCIFTDSKPVQKMTNYVIWITLCTVLESFFKNSLMGVIKALEQQDRAMSVNFISYFCIIIPLAFFFAFQAPKYGLFVDETNETNNRGVGLWVGYIIGIGWQDVGYLYIIATTDW